MTGSTPNYWDMSDDDLRVAWREVSELNFADDYSGEFTERLAYVEDAILQRIGADGPDGYLADPDDPRVQEKIREFAERVPA